MDYDEMDWHDCAPVDLDGDYATGDPALDQTGYQSPRRRGQNLTGFTHTPPDMSWRETQRQEAAQRRERRRRAVAQNVEEARRRTAQRGQSQPIVTFGPGSGYRPGVGLVRQPDLPHRVRDAIAQGMPGRDLGWWRVDVDGDGRAVWTRVDQPGDGPRITLQQTVVQPQPAPRHWRLRPVELTEPSPGTEVW